jgi:hypothetical protein
MSLFLTDCNLEAGGMQVYDGSFTSTIPASISVHRFNTTGDSSSTFGIHRCWISGCI